MKALTINQIKEGTKGALVAGSRETKVQRVCINSKEALPGDLFIAIVGENHDAHRFIPDALAHGCTSFLISDEQVIEDLSSVPDINIILVEDTVLGLQNLSAHYLDLLEIKKIVVTGSTGKTSTRDLTYYVCSEKYNCGKNKGNLNNMIGVPLTILSFDEDVQVGIIEIGMDRFGEIDRLTEIIRPDVGIITNVGLSHIENLGSREGIFKAKMEMARHFKAEDLLIINGDGDLLNKDSAAGDYRLITAGKDGQNDYIISSVDDFGIRGIQFTLEYKNQRENIRLHVPGSHNAYNAALAVAAGMEVGVSMKQAAEGLGKAKLIRGLLTENKGISVINDTYNASPDSMRSAIDLLLNSSCERRVAILGDMFELGELSRQQHIDVGAYLADRKIDLLIAVGDDARFIWQGAEPTLRSSAIYFDHKEDCLEKLSIILKAGDLVLVKGSRGMKMEQIVEKIMNQ